MEKNTKTKIKIGMISFAHMHAYSYAYCLKKIPNVEFAAIADDNLKRGKDTAKLYKVSKYYRDYRDLLEKENEIVGVIVCAENARHAKIVVDCAKAKKHVLCEKPIATKIEDAKKMINACKENNVKLMIAFPVRYSPSIRRVKEILAEETIGEILALNTTNHGRMPPGWFIDKKLAGGGAVMDHTVHVIDLVRWILKKEVKTVYAEIGYGLLHKGIKIDDVGLLSMRLEDDIPMTLDTSWSRPKSYPTWGDVTLKFIGSKGILYVDAFSQTISVYSDKEEKVSWDYWGDNIDFMLVSDFVKCIVEDKEPPITGEDGLAALEVVIAAYLSAKRKEVINLPLAF